MNEPVSEIVIDENEQIQVRKEKLNDLRKQRNAYPNDFKRSHLAKCLHASYESQTPEQLDAEKLEVSLAGRVMTRRLMGKASFVHLQDMTGRIQLYLKQESLPEGVYEDFKTWDIGDIIGVQGLIFKTKTGELSVKASDVRLLAKGLRPLPDKFHGIHDQELCYRQRYLDLLMSEKTRETFKVRTKVIQAIRDYLNSRFFMEVETPMMHVLPGGAAAKPFKTHHNALDMSMYLRIAPELYLKRLVVGGFEQVFEINRNFRNEGLSTRHNPEFTMLEFYAAYWDYKDLMDLTEDMFKSIANHVLSNTEFVYQGHQIDFGKPFERMTVRQAILKYNLELKDSDLDDFEFLKQYGQKLGVQLAQGDGLGKLQIEIFEKTAEHQLIQPTFVTEYPAEISPLARCNDQNAFITDRFELMIVGREIANGFSELNDPEDQAERFRHQVERMERGDDEAMHYDADYIRALEFGLPPTAGEGIGIDRLVMLLTDSPSIRDVILFPHLRPES
ncbi:MAG: lysine--tRNA ligase [Gammaproteobacteria bacterium]